jgi:hypothetical protein
MLPLPFLPQIVGRQNNRNNVPAGTPEEYYRRAVFLPFLDGILTQMSLRFCNHEAAVLRLCGLLPYYLDFCRGYSRPTPSLNFSNDVIKTGSAETKVKIETDCSEAETKTETDISETKSAKKRSRDQHH